MTDINPLLLWSGGLDSTYELWRRMSKGKHVDVLYIDGGQAFKKQTIERRRRKLIAEWLVKNTPGKITFLSTPNSKVSFGGSAGNTYAQPIAWIVGAMEVVDYHRHSEVIVSYVLGDQVSCHINDMQDAWNTLWKFTKHGDVVPLTFPLKYTLKSRIMEELPAELLELIWYCETPADAVAEIACGKCPACVTFYTTTIARDINRRDLVIPPELLAPKGAAVPTAEVDEGQIEVITDDDLLEIKQVDPLEVTE